MAALDNSTRKLLRATYATIKPQPGSRPLAKRAWAKHSFIASFRITGEELNRLRRYTEIDARATQALEAVVSGKATAAALENVPLFVDLEWDSVISIGEALVKLRQQDVESFRNTYSIIVEAFEHEQKERRGESSRPALGVGAASEPKARDRATLLSKGAEGILPHADNKAHASVLATGPSLRTALEWAVRNGVRAAEADRVLHTLSQLFASPTLATKENFESWAAAKVEQTQNLVLAMKQYAPVEPIGLLHLERLNFVPAGIERGELVYSVPLSPGEEVNISHKEWSNTSEEFSKITTDFMEAYSEEGVVEKSELAQATSSQEQHSSGFNTGVTASGGYGPVSITSSVGFSAASSASSSEAVARNQSVTTTRKASARSKKEHKISFKVASASGTEDQQVRKIRNPFADKATRLDYYQLVRRWRVDLFRYGLRLTYDLTIPEPGSGILSKIQEIQQLKAALEQGFGDANASSPWARFDLKPGDINRVNYSDLAGEYNAAVPSPPPERKDYDKVATHDWKSKEEAEQNQFWVLEVDVDEDYEIDFVTVETEQSHFTDEDDWHLTVQSIDDFYGVSGKRELVYWTKFLGSAYVELRVGAHLKESVFQEWQLKAWSAMREAAQARYEANRQNLKQRLSSLLEELGAQDPLSLRKIEREEVMKGVLRWLFGADFDFAPAVPESLYGSDVAVFSKDPWSQAFAEVFMSVVRAQGEIIKFLHHAIEWENMLYFLYPYFWSHPSRWELKKYLDHPDLMHRVFLKSGSARVVLTIRPGFEKHFVSFLETGKFDGLSQDDPYWKITDEMEAYANTNYPGIRSANPIEGARPLLSPKQRKAWGEMQGIMALLENYHDANGAYPTTEQGLAALSSLGSLPGEDPWGNPYVYVSPGVTNDYDLASYGADGEPGGEEDAADITSWAEANLIGRWCEYTPTSALDIAFNETMPSA